MKNIYSLAMVALLVLSGCELGSHSSDSTTTLTPSPTPSSTVNATGITISAASTDSNGNAVSGSPWGASPPSPNTLQLSAVLTPSNATGTVSWSSNGSSNVTVDPSTGLVTVYGYDGTNNGTTTITATINGHTANFIVNSTNFG